MSFRVKSTHQLLQTNPPPKQEKPSLSFLEQEESKDAPYVSTFLPKNTFPNETSLKGIAIRTIPSAQADHM